MPKAAEACKKVNMTFGIGLGTTPDSIDTAGALFDAFGAEAITAQGEVKVRSNSVRQGLQYARQVLKQLPNDAVSYDDASNNRALIWSPPSARAVARRDAPPVAADCWTFPAPKGPKGRSVWKFCRNKSTAKELVEFPTRSESPTFRKTLSWSPGAAGGCGAGLQSGHAADDVGEAAKWTVDRGYPGLGT
jgi:hypothetical protein